MWGTGGIEVTGDEPKHSETYPRVASSTAGYIWTDLSSNPVLRAERSAINSLWHDTAKSFAL
jgi:hypothetical protein